MTGGNPVGSLSPVRVWNLSTWQTLFSINHQAAVTSVSFSSDGSKILTVDRERQSGDSITRLWNATTGSRLQSYLHGNVQVLAAASAPDDSTILTGAADGRARLFDAATGELLQVFHLGTNSSAIPAVAFSPDGTRILTAHADGWGGLVVRGDGAGGIALGRLGSKRKARRDLAHMSTAGAFGAPWPGCAFRRTSLHA